jgi:hypothetical protein
MFHSEDAAIRRKSNSAIPPEIADLLPRIGRP